MNRTLLTSMQHFITKLRFPQCCDKKSNRKEREKKGPDILLRLGTLKENTQIPRRPWVQLAKCSYK